MQAKTLGDFIKDLNEILSIHGDIPVVVTSEHGDAWYPFRSKPCTVDAYENFGTGCYIPAEDIGYAAMGDIGEKKTLVTILRL